jgi:hypothetical protein
MCCSRSLTMCSALVGSSPYADRGCELVLLTRRHNVACLLREVAAPPLVVIFERPVHKSLSHVGSFL